MVFVRALRWRAPAAVGAAVLAGCNAILSIEEASLRPADGEDASADASVLADTGVDPSADASPDVSFPTPYPAAVMSDAPAAYWRLGDTSREVIRDVRGERDGTLVGEGSLGVPGALAGDPDPAIRLGADGRIVIGDHFDFVGPATFTIEAWIKPAQTPVSGTNTIWRKSGAGSPAPGTELTFNAAIGYVTFERRDASKTVVSLRCSQITFEKTAFAHIAVTFDGVTTRLYFAGKECATGFVDGSVPDNTESAQWGSFDGSLDELAVYDHALAPSRIAAHVAAAK